MIKAIALLRRRPDLTREQFIARYETAHAPLILSLFPEIASYRRNFVDRGGAYEFGTPIDFDCVTEMTFADRAAYQAFAARAALPEVAAAVAEDEAHLFDRSGTRMMLVDPLPAPPADTALADLAAERAIREGLARFARVIDAKDWAALESVFARDLTFDYGLGEQAGIAALEANMRRFLDHCGPTQHLIGSISIDVAGTRGVSRAYVQARHQRAGGGPVFDSNGEYIDTWQQRAEGWRIVRREAVWATHHGDPAIISAGSGDLG